MKRIRAAGWRIKGFWQEPSLPVAGICRCYRRIFAIERGFPEASGQYIYFFGNNEISSPGDLW
jgi:hypothetical protein